MKLALPVFLGLFGAAASATAGPVLYNLTFTGTGTVPISGSFLYDAAAATNPFSNFVVNLTPQISLDLTASANAPTTFNCNPSPLPAPGHDTFAALFSGTTPCGGPLLWSVGAAEKDSARILLGDDGSADQKYLDISRAEFVLGASPKGNGTFTVAAVPEPGTLGLLLGGGAVLALWRRRSRSAA